MPSSKSLSITCLILSTASLAASCFAGVPPGTAWKLVLAAGLPLLVGLYNLWERSSSLSTLGLCISVGLAGVAGLSGAEPRLAILGVAAALAAWDLALFALGLEGHSLAGRPGRLERKHYQALGLGVGTGLLAAWVGNTARLTLPFGVMVILAALTIWSLDWVMQGLRGKKG